VTSLPLVVGAVIVDEFPVPTRVLAARRTRPPELAGQWEFPGGKLERGETPAQALVREIAEELAIDIVHDELPSPVGETWPASNGYRMRLYYATFAQGTPLPSDGHDRVRWLTRDELSDVEWLSSDREVIQHLRI
jgi:8-oxo-dGTP diphosphatase